MKTDLLIRNGLVITAKNSFEADLSIHQEKIAGIFSPGEKHDAEEVIDAKGLFLLPGAIDSHVHFNEPGRETWEGFEAGSKSAAAGGVTTVIDMPLNSSPCTLNVKEFERKRSIGESLSVVDFGLWGGATPDNIDELKGLHEAGALGFKAFMSNSGIEDFRHIDDGILVEVLQRLGRLKQVLGLHAENDSMATHLAKKLKALGRIDRKAWLESRPPFVEEEAVNRALFLAKHISPEVSLHFVHTTLAANMEAIAEAKRQGLNVTVETCPHYLMLTAKDLLELGPVAKCAPPLRTEKEVEALWKSVEKGWVDTIGSDHSPCTLELKAKGKDNIWQAWGGISGIQTMLPVVFSEGVVKRRISPTQLVAMLSMNPARLFGLYPKKGTLQPGSDADLVLFNPEKRWTVKAEDLLYKNPHSPFIGRTITGSVELTLLRGKIIWKEGEVKAPPGIGKFLPRQILQRAET
jgi:allantoinase